MREVFECILSTWSYLTKRFQTPIHVTCDALEIGWRSKVVLVWSFPWNISWSLFMFVYVHSYLWLHNHSYDYQQGCLTNILVHVLFSGNWYIGTLSTIWIAYTLNRVSLTNRTPLAPALLPDIHLWNTGSSAPIIGFNLKHNSESSGRVPCLLP